MKVLVQRVKSAKVEIDEKINGEIAHGLLLYVCFEEGDNLDSVDQAVNKIEKLRIFEDEQHKMNKNILQIKGQILSISQFTLSWDGRKGHRPSFDRSMDPNTAKLHYRKFNDLLGEKGIVVEKGIFGTEMQVSSVNDGPVTFFLSF